MNELERLEDKLLSSGETLKDTFGKLLNNMGRVVALITALVTVIVSFADIGFSGLTLKDTLPSLLLLMTSSVIIYFSMEDAGEHLGERCAEHVKAKQRYQTLCDKITGEDILSLREYLHGCAEDGLRARRRALMLTLGISHGEYEAYLRGEPCERHMKRKLSRISSLRPIIYDVGSILSGGAISYDNSCQNPERRKIGRLILKLLPSILCMTLTVSLMLSLKSGLNASDVLNALLKLSTLPLAAFRGYSMGYSYSKLTMTAWYKRCSELIEGYIGGRTEGK